MSPVVRFLPHSRLIHARRFKRSTFLPPRHVVVLRSRPRLHASRPVSSFPRPLTVVQAYHGRLQDLSASRQRLHPDVRRLFAVHAERSSSAHAPSPATATTSATWRVPTDAVRLPPPAAFAPDADRRGPAPPDINQAPGQGVTQSNSPLPLYAPVTVRGPNGSAFDVLAFVDSGADISYLHVDFATTHLGSTVVSDPSAVNHLADNTTAPRRHCAEPIQFWCGAYSCQATPDVLDMSPKVIPYLLLGRDLMQLFAISLTGIPTAFPTSAAELKQQDQSFIDLSARLQRLFDDSDLSVEENRLRDLLRSDIDARLQQHALQVPINSFITHPDAPVQILHDAAAPPPKPLSYGRKASQAYLDQYITEQVDVWLRHGKLVPWDSASHGAYPRHCMPLLPVVTHLPSGDIHKVRVCVDARSLNANLLNDPTPLPNISVLYQRLSGLRFHSEFDAVSCFNQFPIQRDHQHKVAIRWNGQVYAWAGAPFGVRHLSSHVQRVFTTIFQDQPWVSIFVDNFVVSSATLEEHAVHCRQFIDRCNEFNIKLDPVKAKIAFTRLRTLGNVLTATGVAPDPEKVATVMSWPTPTTPSQVSGFLGFCNYLRSYVRHFADLCAPLDALRNVKPSQFIWTSEANSAFELLKHAVAHAPALNFPDPHRPFAVAVDASSHGIGAVLFQPRSDGDLPCAENIVSFASRSLASYERRYSPYVSECNGLMFALKYFEDYLYGRPFVVYTDHASLTYLQTQANLNRTLRNWYAEILQYDFTIRHVPGYLNVLADALSRMYPDAWGLPPSPNVEHYLNATRVHWPDQQGLPLESVETGMRSRDRRKCSKSLPVLSETEQWRAIRKAHDKGHFGTRAVHAALRADNMLWPGMSKQIRQVCLECATCQRWTKSNHVYHPIRPVHGAIPWDTLQLDIITSFKDEPAADGSKYILIVTDVFSSFCILRSMPTKEAASVARHLHQIFSDFGPPRTLQCDNDAAFTADIVRELVHNFGCSHRTILPYNPRSAGKVERHVGVTSDTLRKLLDADKMPTSKWPNYLPLVQLLMNSKIKHLTNASPFALVFNRSANNWASYTGIDPVSISQADYDAWFAREQHLHEMIFPVVRERSTALQAQYTAAFKPHQTSTKRLPVGTIVMLHDTLRTSKNSPPWIGPYTVARVSSMGSYTLRDFSGSLYHRDVPRDALKPVEAPHIPSPSDHTYTPVRILSDRPTPDGTGIEYEVKWSGYEDATWVPSATLDAFDNVVTAYKSSSAPQQPAQPANSQPPPPAAATPVIVAPAPVVPAIVPAPSSGSATASTSHARTAASHVPSVSAMPPQHHVPRQQHAHSHNRRSSRQHKPNTKYDQHFVPK